MPFNFPLGAPSNSPQLWEWVGLRPGTKECQICLAIVLGSGIIMWSHASQWNTRTFLLGKLGESGVVFLMDIASNYGVMRWASQGPVDAGVKREREREKNKGLASQLSPCIKTRLKFTLVFSGYVSHSPQHTPFFFFLSLFCSTPWAGSFGYHFCNGPRGTMQIRIS